VTGEGYISDFDHFIEYGQYKGLLASDLFAEQTYLTDNPDVAAAVYAGKFADGFQHWLMYGQYEGRRAV
jgi:alkaline phosphatase D